jgi:hypothetical protein
LVVVFVPSLCCVVVLLLDCPVEGFDVELLLLDIPFDGSDMIVLLLFCPSGFSVVVVLELVWANPALPRTKLSPMTAVAILDFESMVFLLVSCGYQHAQLERPSIAGRCAPAGSRPKGDVSRLLSAAW